MYFDLPNAGALMKLSRCFRSCSGRVGGAVGLHGFLLAYLIFVGHGHRCACMCKRPCACVCACMNACVHAFMCLQTCKTAAEVVPGFSRYASPHFSHGRREIQGLLSHGTLFATRHIITCPTRQPFLFH